MPPTVLLFDIDGTILLTGGAGRRAMDAAFRKETGQSDVFLDFQFGGMTDFGIVRAGLERVGREFTEDAARQILETYVAILVGEVDAAEQYRLMPGVLAVLDAVMGIEGVSVGLGTGNIERGARIKLGRASLSERFTFGGFGSDAEERSQLLARGAERGAERLGVVREDCRVVVIGDTPKDISAARAIGADCVAVATGGHDVTELEGHAPDAVFRDLTDGSAVDVILGR